jgi:hypothetical protein
VKRAVWPVLVVVTAVDAEHVLEVAAPEVRTVRADCLDRILIVQRLAQAFAFGAWTGVRGSP